MNLKKLLKDNGKIFAIATTAIGAIGWLANDKMNKIKKQDEIIEIVQSAEFKNAIIETIEIALNQKGGINSQILDIRNSLDRGKEKMNHLEGADEKDYRELADKLTKIREAVVESERRALERDLKDCRDSLRARK